MLSSHEVISPMLCLDRTKWLVIELFHKLLEIDDCVAVCNCIFTILAVCVCRIIPLWFTLWNMHFINFTIFVCQRWCLWIPINNIPILLSFVNFGTLVGAIRIDYKKPLRMTLWIAVTFEKLYYLTMDVNCG